MKIGIIGAGRVGATLAQHFARTGHEVTLSNSRGPRTLADLVRGMGSSVRATTAAEAATFGQVVVVSVPYGRFRELPAERLHGKVVVDTCNYRPARDGHDPDLDAGTTTSSKKIRAFTGANLVKAFNAIRWDDLRDRGRPRGDPARLAIPVSGTDWAAKAVVSGLIRDIGFDPVDAGDLGRGGRKHEPGTRVFTAEMSAQELSGALGPDTSAARG
jgi:8-hydroxy-5-deazaflavin:NADPH oxidoreductase